MLTGLMQPTPLQISSIIRFAAKAHGDREIVSLLVDEPLWRYGWADCEKRKNCASVDCTEAVVASSAVPVVLETSRSPSSA